MKLRRIGIIKNRTEKPAMVSGRDGLELQDDFDKAIEKLHKTSEDISEIIINEDLTAILDGIDEFSHIIVLYWGHKVSEEGRSLTRVHPMGKKEFPFTGIAATCSPARPNPVLMTVVRLCGRKGNQLQVTGLDAINESPVIDIKPYVRELFPQEDVMEAEWMQKAVKKFNDGSR